MTKIKLFDAKDARGIVEKYHGDIRKKELERIVDMPTKEKELVDKVISLIELNAYQGKLSVKITEKDVPELVDFDTMYCIESLLEILGFDTKSKVTTTHYAGWLIWKDYDATTAEIEVSWNTEDLQKTLIDQYQSLEKLKVDATKMRNKKD